MDGKLEFDNINGEAENIRIDGKPYDLFAVDETEEGNQILGFLGNARGVYERLALTVRAAELLRDEPGDDWRFDLLVIRARDPRVAGLPDAIVDVRLLRGGSVLG